MLFMHATLPFMSAYVALPHKRLTKDEARQFCTLYRQALLASGQASIKGVLKSMHKGNHYFKHASILAEQVRRQDVAREG